MTETFRRQPGFAPDDDAKIPYMAPDPANIMRRSATLRPIAGRIMWRRHFSPEDAAQPIACRHRHHRGTVRSIKGDQARRQNKMEARNFYSVYDGRQLEAALLCGIPISPMIA